MHRVLLYLIGNVLFLVLHTGKATGIRIASPASRSRSIWIEITPFEPDQRSYLRREAPRVHHHLFTPPFFQRGANAELLTFFIFAPYRKSWDTNSNSIVAGILSKISPRVSSR